MVVRDMALALLFRKMTHLISVRDYQSGNISQGLSLRDQQQQHLSLPSPNLTQGSLLPVRGNLAGSTNSSTLFCIDPFQTQRIQQQHAVMSIKVRAYDVLYQVCSPSEYLLKVLLVMPTVLCIWQGLYTQPTPGKLWFHMYVGSVLLSYWLLFLLSFMCFKLSTLLISMLKPVV
jgi:hypothetical protein